MANSVPTLTDPSLLKTQAYVNGEWVNAISGQTFTVTDPAPGTVIGTMPDMNKVDVQLAINAAATALSHFRITTAREWAHMLHRWHQLLIDNADDLAKLITLENGKPLFKAKSKVTYAAHYFEWFSGEATYLDSETIHASTADHRISTIKESIGVCGLITPWNWPIGMPSRKIGPARAAGCTVMMKSPGETPLTAAAMAELAHRAGIPPGVINIVTAHGKTKEVHAELTSSPIVKKLSFTGSTGVGKTLMRQSADTVKKLSFELGGNAPFVVFEDLDLQAAVNGTVACKFRSSGETCVCASRIYVQRALYGG